MTEREKMLNGEWYDTSDPWLVSQRNTARDVSEQYNRTSENEIEMRKDGTGRSPLYDRNLQAYYS